MTESQSAATQRIEMRYNILAVLPSPVPFLITRRAEVHGAMPVREWKLARRASSEARQVGTGAMGSARRVSTVPWTGPASL